MTRRLLLIALAGALLAACSAPQTPSGGSEPMDVAALSRAPAPGQEVFGSAESAVSALDRAVAARDREALRRIFGPQLADLETGDPELDEAHLQRFASDLAVRREVVAVPEMPGVSALVVGPEGTTFPVPIVQGAKGWFFDSAAGATEIRMRRIGANELRAMEVLSALVSAQQEYFSVDRDGDGAHEYALRISSTPGQRNGLHWDVADGSEPPSPAGPRLAQAASDAGGSTRVPYHGYLYRALSRQGPGAPGGAREFVVDGKVTGGFAFIAAPAHYGVSGIATFMVGPDGVVYEFDLGPDSAAMAEAVTVYDPSGWTRATPLPE